jgi:hypothetical protein
MLLTGICSGQTFAVHFETPDIDQPVNRKTRDKCVDIIKNKLKLNSWAYMEKEGALVPDASFRSGEGEVAADYLLSIYFKIYENYQPDLHFKKDTTGKVTSTYFALYSLSQYNFILTDLRTSEILYFKSKYGRDIKEREATSMSVDMAKYFGKTDPARLLANAPRDYQIILNKIWSDFQPSFQKYYEDRTPDFQNMLATAVMNPVVNTPQKIQAPFVDNGKLKEFKCAPIPGVQYFDGLFVTVFSLDTIGNYVIPQNYKWWVVEELNDGLWNLDTYFPIPSRNKDAGEALEAGRQLYYLPGEIPYAGILTAEEPITIDIRGLNLASAGDIYNFLSRSPRIRLINTLEQSTLDKLHERFKGGQFVDSGYSLSSLGARYILTASDAQFSLQDAQSGTVIATCPSNYGDKGVYDLLQKALDLKVSIIKPTNEKKGAIKEALIYSPMGFYEDFYFDVIHRTVENVNGKSLYREQEIGKGWVLNEERYGYVFAEAKFQKGEKEIGDAYNSKQEILFLSREFKFPFIGTFK